MNDEQQPQQQQSSPSSTSLPSYSYYKYSFDQTHSPQCVASASNLASESESVDSEDNYFRWLEWSPDSTCILTSSNDKTLRLWDFPSITENKSSTEVSEKKISPMTPFQSNRLPEPIYDFAWYPYMQRMDPSSSVYVVSMPHQPIQLYDTSSTTLRCSYVYENHVERIVGPTCVRFSNDGTRLLGGMKGSLVLFDVHRPGKTPLAVISTTRRCSSSNVDLGSSPHFSQRGIFSSLAYNDPYQCIAVASYSKTIGLYDFHAQGLCRIPCTTAPTYVTWDASGTYLVASHRHGTGHVTVYDVRMPKTCVWKYVRGFGTQQKTRVQVVGSLVVMAACGDQGRWVHGTDLFTGTHTGSLLQEPSTVTSTVLRDEWFLSCSGKRHFHPPSMELESLDLNVQEGTVSSSVDLHPPSSTMHCFNDSSLKVWKVPGEYTTWSSDSEHEPSMLMQCA